MKNSIFRNYLGGYVRVICKNVQDMSYKKRKTIIVEDCNPDGKPFGNTYCFTQKQFFAKVPKRAPNPTGQVFCFEEVEK